VAKEQSVFLESYATSHFLWSEILKKIGFNVFCNFTVIITSLLFMIGHVREIRQMY
jgi:hypothetical protein